MQLFWGHWLGLAVALSCVAVLGAVASRKVKTADDFTLAGKASGVTMVAGTIIGTIVGGAATIGTAQLAFKVGLAAWWFTLGCGLALLLLGFFYAKPLRDSGLATVPEFLVVNYGKEAGPLCSLTSSAGIFFSLVANLLSAVPLIMALLHLSSMQAAGLVLIFTLLYVFLGGVWGTGLVGVFKTVLIIASLGTAGVIAWQGVGGASGLTGSLPSGPWFDLFGRGWSVDVGSALSVVVGVLSTQTYIQAVYGAKDVRAARGGVLLAAAITLPIGLLGVLVGLFMRVHHPDIVPIDALPLFVLRYLPDWLGGLAIGALLLASIGSAAGLILGMATMLTRDIAARVLPIRPGYSELRVTRVIVFVVAFSAVAVTMANLGSLVLDWNYLSMGLRGAGTFLPLSAAVFVPGRIKSRWAMLAIAGGALTSLAWKLILPESGDPLYPGLLVSAVMLLAGWRRGQKGT